MTEINKYSIEASLDLFFNYVHNTDIVESMDKYIRATIFEVLKGYDKDTQLKAFGFELSKAKLSISTDSWFYETFDNNKSLTHVVYEISRFSDHDDNFTLRIPISLIRNPALDRITQFMFELITVREERKRKEEIEQAESLTKRKVNRYHHMIQESQKIKEELAKEGIEV